MDKLSEFSNTGKKIASSLIIILLLNFQIAQSQENEDQFLPGSSFKFTIGKNGSNQFILPNVDTSKMGLFIHVSALDNNHGLTTEEEYQFINLAVENCTFGGHRVTEWLFLFDSDLTNQTKIDLTVSTVSSYNGFLEVRLMIWYLDGFYSENINVKDGVFHKIDLENAHSGFHDPDVLVHDNWLGAGANLSIWIRNIWRFNLTLSIDSLEINDSLVNKEIWKPIEIPIDSGELLSISIQFPDLTQFNSSKLMGGWLYIKSVEASNYTSSHIIQVFDLVIDPGIYSLAATNPDDLGGFIDGIVLLITLNLIFYSLIIIVIIFLIFKLRKRKRNSII